MGAASCPACGRAVVPPPPPPAPSAYGARPDRIDEAVADIKQGTKELIDATARVGTGIVSGAKATVKDPKNTAKRVVRRVAKELDEVRRDVEGAVKKKK